MVEKFKNAITSNADTIVTEIKGMYDKIDSTIMIWDTPAVYLYDLFLASSLRVCSSGNMSSIFKIFVL